LFFSSLLLKLEPNDCLHLSSNRDLDLDTSLDVDDDLLDDLGRGSQVDQALVDAHLVEVPGLGTLTAGGLAGLLTKNKMSAAAAVGVKRRRLTHHDLEGLGGQADGALSAEVLVLGALEELGADLLEGGDLARGEGDACGLALVFHGSNSSSRWMAGRRTDLVDLGALAGEVLLGLVVRHLGWWMD
jgi:hypothetical protein